MRKDEFIKSWTGTIKAHCDLIDNQIDQLKVSESDEQLEYVLKRLGHINDRLNSVTVSPGKSKSYATQVRITMSNISTIQKEIELWQTEGIKPEFFKEKHNA